MKFTLRTTLKNQDLETVITHFNEDLFDYLIPKNGLSKITYEGEQVGNIIWMKIIGLDFKVHIIDRQQSQTSFYFTDSGLKLPFPLVNWKHKHQLDQLEADVLITDAIEFKGKNLLYTALLYPFIVFGFLPRVYLYKKYFAQCV